MAAKGENRSELAVIIPTLNAAARLPACLKSVRDGARDLAVTLIVSDGGSTDDTAALARQAGATVLTGPAGRGGQLARGAGAADADWLFFVHADSELPADWGKIAAAHLRISYDAGVFRLRFRASGIGARITGAWANLRSRLGLPFGDQGLLISRPLYDRIGGYPDIPLMEDVAIAVALKGRIRLLPATITTSADRYERGGGWFLVGARNIWRQLRFLSGADPARLARRYGRDD